MLVGIRRGCIGLMALLVVGPVVAAEYPCPDTRFRVISEEEVQARGICAAAARAASVLAACNVPLERPILIEVTDEFNETCLGLYHCGKDRIEILAPAEMQHRRAPGSDLAFVPIDSFFTAILTHELAHAAFDATPCPFETCLTESEYVAYTMQIMSLPDKLRSRYEAGIDMTAPVSRDSVNAVTLFMAPDTFMRRAWVHLNQRPDVCAYIRDVMEGRIRMHHPHP